MLTTLLLLAAQADGTVTLSVAIGLAGMLVGGALVFGALRQNVAQLNAAVDKLTAKVESLTEIVSELSAKLREADAARVAVAAVTAKHTASRS